MRVCLIIFAACLFAPSAEARFQEKAYRICAAYLAQYKKESEIKKYGVAGYAIRAVFRDPHPVEIPPGAEDLPPRRCGGFLVLHIPPAKMNKWWAILAPNLQWPVNKITEELCEYPYDFSLFGPLSYHVLRPLLHFTTTAAFGKPKEFTLGVSAVLGGLVLAYVYDKAYDEPFRDAVHREFKRDIDAHAPEWRQLEKQDYRYRMPADHPPELAFIHNRFIYRYHQFMNETYDDEDLEQRRESLLSFPQFFPVTALIEKGLLKNNLYFYERDFRPQPSLEQVDQLIQNTIWKLNMVEAIAIWMRTGQEEALLGEFLNSKYARALIALYERGLLAVEDLQYRLQEDIHWQAKFRSWDILHVSRRKIENRKITNQVLSLRDIRLQSMREAGSGVRLNSR